MNPTGVTTEQEFVLRRLGESSKDFGLELLDAAANPLAVAFALAAVGCFVGLWLYRASHRPAAGVRPRGTPTPVRLMRWGAGLFTFAAAATYLARLFLLDVVAGPTGDVSAQFAGLNRAVWWTVAVGSVALGVVFTAVMYVRDSRAVHWLWAVKLATLRSLVYAIVMGVFLLPAVQTWERTEKRSRVLILLDVSPSVTAVSDEVVSLPGKKGKPRVDHVIDFLTDEKVAFIAKIVEKNPVYVYRFGNRLDDDTAEFKAGAAAMARADWDAFAKYDFKPWLLRGLSPAGVEAMKGTEGWNGDAPGTPDWAATWAANWKTTYEKAAKPAEGNNAVEKAAPAGMDEKDAATAHENVAKLDKRVEVARAVAGGTNAPESVAAAISREAANMVQGVIVFSDGRSSVSSDSVYAELRDRAAKENVPVFTVAVGEDRQTVAVTITDVVAPDRAPPDEPFKVIVEADGVGLANQEVEVKLGLFLPSRDPKKDPPDHELTANLTFQPGDPPHGQAEFVLDPAKLPDELTEEGKDGPVKKRQLKEGTWAAVAKIAKDKREAFPDPEHVRQRDGIVVLKKPLRVLLVSSGPSREYLTLKTLLVRETQQNRAELSVYLQNEAGGSGLAVQDVPPERLLTKFPSRLDTADRGQPEDRYYNLNEYDVLVLMDPDWSEVSEQAAKNVQNWVENLGGGLIYVAGPLNTFQLARAEPNSRLSPILDVLPVVPDDIIVVNARPLPKTPRRLYLNPPPDSDVLKLDDAVEGDPVAGWERFFTGRDKYTPDADLKRELFPRRGFFSVYPVKTTKSNPVLAEFADLGDKGDKETHPWLVAAQAVRGKTAYLASGETYRVRALDPVVGPQFYERFWIKLARNVAANRDVKASRGRILLNKEYVSGSPVRVQARLLAPTGEPYPVGAVDPKFRVQPLTAAGERVEREDPATRQKVKVELGPFEMKAKKSATGFDGYYQGQVLADARQFPPGDFRYKVVVDVPDAAGETIDGEFMVRRSDPEMDNTRPDFTALLNMASEFDKPMQDRLSDGPARETLLEKLPKEGGKSRLAFRLGEPEAAALIPQCLKAEERNSRNRGPVRDLWDQGFTVPPPLTGWFATGPVTVAYVLLVLVGLLSWEWATRKLLRLA